MALATFLLVSVNRLIQKIKTKRLIFPYCKYESLLLSTTLLMFIIKKMSRKHNIKIHE